MSLSKLESNIKILEDEVKEIDLSMSVTGLNYDELNNLYCKREKLNMEIDKMMEEWLIISKNNNSTNEA